MASSQFTSLPSLASITSFFLQNVSNIKNSPSSTAYEDGVYDIDAPFPMDDLPPFSLSDRRASYSSSSSSEDGLATPPPFKPTDAPPNSSSQKQLQAAQPFDDWAPELLVLPSSRLLTQPPPSHALPPLPAPTSNPKPRSKPKPSSNRPSREEEESRRGRSRWPRLLWRSEVDPTSLEVLEKYHARAVGGPLPVLERRRGERGVREWSDRMERAGL